MPGSSRTSRERSEPFKISRRRDSSGVPRMTYVEPRSRATRRTVSTRSSPSISRKWTPRIDGEPPQRGELYLLLLRQARARPGRTQIASMSAPRRCAERHARRMIRCDFGCGSTSASTRSRDRLLAERLEDGRPTPRLDVLGHLAQRDLAQRGEVLVPEEVLERDLGPLARVDLARLEPLLELLGREVDEHDLVRLVEDPVGERLADADVRSARRPRRSGSRGAGR